MRFESTPFCNLFQWVAYQMPIFFPIYVWVNYSSSSITLYLDALFVCSYLFKISQTFLCIFLTLQLQVFTEIKSLQRSSLYHTFNLPAMYLAKKTLNSERVSKLKISILWGQNHAKFFHPTGRSWHIISVLAFLKLIQRQFLLKFVFLLFKSQFSNNSNKTLSYTINS